jgi:hypothetical protein
MRQAMAISKLMVLVILIVMASAVAASAAGGEGPFLLWAFDMKGTKWIIMYHCPTLATCKKGMNELQELVGDTTPVMCTDQAGNRLAHQ